MIEELIPKRNKKARKKSRVPNATDRIVSEFFSRPISSLFSLHKKLLWRSNRQVLPLLSTLVNFRAMRTLIGQILSDQIEWKESSSVRSPLRRTLRVGPRQLIVTRQRANQQEKWKPEHALFLAYVRMWEPKGTELVSELVSTDIVDLFEWIKDEKIWIFFSPRSDENSAYVRTYSWMRNPFLVTKWIKTKGKLSRIFEEFPSISCHFSLKQPKHIHSVAILVHLHG